MMPSVAVVFQPATRPLSTYSAPLLPLPNTRSYGCVSTDVSY